jgi:hypothetical protein
MTSSNITAAAPVDQVAPAAAVQVVAVLADRERVVPAVAAVNAPNGRGGLTDRQIPSVD